MAEELQHSSMTPLPGGDISMANTESSAPSFEAAPSVPPLSTDITSSSLSDPPTTDPPGPSSQLPAAQPSNAGSSSSQGPQLSAQTEQVLARINANAASAAAAGTPGWEAAKEQIMKGMATSDKFPTPTPPRETSAPKAGGRGGRAPSSARNGDAELDEIVLKMNTDVTSTPPARRGRGGGRPRGRGRGGGRGGKRKREDVEDGDSDSSEVYTPIATTTKSGRSIQKPTAFVPPPPASPTTNKRKRTTYRRNPESALCKVCLRGTSPAANMIVFCDGCNAPYHQYCHKPPIDQSVIDEVDKEWYCKQCEKERVLPVPDAEIAHFVSAEGASAEQRQRYFASLPQGMLVTMLTKATTLHPDLPVFGPDFNARTAVDKTQHSTTQTNPNGHDHSAATSGKVQPADATAGAGFVDEAEEDEDEGYGPDEHPANYPRPGQGLMKILPPEQEDLQWLVDDNDRFGVFSHLYQVDSNAANGGMSGSGV